MFVLKIVTDFSAAHSLRNYPGDCARLHGIIGKWKSWLPHLCLMKIAPFDKLNPTAENLAKYLYDEVAKLINNATVKVKKIIIWETSRASVSYSEQTL